MVKLIDIAQDLNISPSTVSDVLNDKWEKRQISEGLAKRVLKRAQELGYHPNFLGRQLRLQKTFTIGVIFTDLTKPYSAQILSGLEYVFASNEYGTFICNSLNDSSRELNWLEDIFFSKPSLHPLPPFEPWCSRQSVRELIQFYPQLIPLRFLP